MTAGGPCVCSIHLDLQWITFSARRFRVRRWGTGVHRATQHRKCTSDLEWGVTTSFFDSKDSFGVPVILTPQLKKDCASDQKDGDGCHCNEGRHR
jgi:hypothetical protein